MISRDRIVRIRLHNTVERSRAQLMSGEEVDIIPPGTELGKYMDKTMSGYVWDKVDSLSASARKGKVEERTQHIWNQYRRYGMICGTGCMELTMTDKIMAVIQCVKIFFTRICDVIREYGKHLLGLTERVPDPQEIGGFPIYSPDRNVASKFTPEYRLVQNSRFLAQSAVQLEATFREVEATALALSLLKTPFGTEDQDNRLKQASVLKIMALKQSIKEQMQNTENLLAIEGNLVKKIRDSIFPEEVLLPMMLERERARQEPRLPESYSDDDTEDSIEKELFEFEGTTTDKEDATRQYVPRDEIYQATLDPENGAKEESVQLPQHEKNDELVAVQKAVMHQLKSSLAPRRAGMIEREVEAYMKAYGKPPESTLVEIREAKTKADLDKSLLETSSPGLHDSSSSSSFEMVSDEEVGNEKSTQPNASEGRRAEESFVFGDEDSEEEGPNEMFKSDFRASLQAALLKRGAGGGNP